MSAFECPPPLSRVPSARRLETLALALGLCLPVPALAATGLSVPLPNVVERLAAALVPWAEPAGLAGGEIATGAGGEIVRAAGETGRTAPVGPPAAAATAPAKHRAAKGQPAKRLVSARAARPGATHSTRPTSTPAAAPGRPTPTKTTSSPTVSAPAAEPETRPKAAADPSGSSDTTNEPAPAPSPGSTDEPTTTTEPAPLLPATGPVVETVDKTVDDTVTVVGETVEDTVTVVDETLTKLPGLGG